MSSKLARLHERASQWNSSHLKGGILDSAILNTHTHSTYPPPWFPHNELKLVRSVAFRRSTPTPFSHPITNPPTEPSPTVLHPHFWVCRESRVLNPCSPMLTSEKFSRIFDDARTGMYHLAISRLAHSQWITFEGGYILRGWWWGWGGFMGWGTRCAEHQGQLIRAQTHCNLLCSCHRAPRQTSHHGGSV